MLFALAYVSGSNSLAIMFAQEAVMCSNKNTNDKGIGGLQIMDKYEEAVKLCPYNPKIAYAFYRAGYIET